MRPHSAPGTKRGDEGREVTETLHRNALTQLAGRLGIPMAYVDHLTAQSVEEQDGRRSRRSRDVADVGAAPTGQVEGAPLGHRRRPPFSSIRPMLRINHIFMSRHFQVDRVELPDLPAPWAAVG